MRLRGGQGQFGGPEREVPCLEAKWFGGARWYWVLAVERIGPCRREALIKFVSTHSFEGAAKKLLTEDDRRELELLLVEEPRRGKVIERTGGFRKVRFARPSRREGKSGGTRVVYYFLDRRDRI